MKKRISGILCILTVFLLLNSIAFSIFFQEEFIYTKSLEDEHKITHKSDFSSLIFNEIEEADTFSDDESEKEFLPVQLTLTHHPIEFYSFIDKSETLHFNIPQKSFVKSFPKWLETRQIII